VLLMLLSFLPSGQLNDNSELQSTNNIIGLPENKNMDFDILDAYKLKFGNTVLFGNYGTFILDIGLPNKVTVFKTDYLIKSKTDLEKAISTAKNPDPVTLHYPGIDMWYTYNNSVVPFTIDFRKTEKSISYGKVNFDRNYNFAEFKKQFPNSANPSLKMPHSFFEITTKENVANVESFILKRKTKDDPNAEPLVEFTFEKDRLIFIIFANF
jgi:hypothetical protein